MMSKRHKAYSKLVRGWLQVLAAIYEMIFDEDAPSVRDVLRG